MFRYTLFIQEALWLFQKEDARFAVVNFTEHQELNSALESAESRVIVTKSEAAASGSKYFFTGKKCKRGHLSNRLVSTGGCVSCAKARKRGAPKIKKPNGYWLVAEHIARESKKYKTKSEMKLKNNPAYSGMCKLKLGDILFPLGKKTNGYWTKERCFMEAEKYSSISSFSEGSPTAYSRLCDQDLIADASYHMSREKRGPNYWTFDRCVAEAEKYKSRNELRTLSSGCYDKALSMGWINEITSHMESGYKTSNCLYIWSVDGLDCVYKVGITSTETVCSRVDFVANSNKIKPLRIIAFAIKGGAHAEERKILSDNIKYDGFSGDGKTEFRVIDKSKFNIIIKNLSEKYTRLEI